MVAEVVLRRIRSPSTTNITSPPSAPSPSPAPSPLPATKPRPSKQASLSPATTSIPRSDPWPPPTRSSSPSSATGPLDLKPRNTTWLQKADRDGSAVAGGVRVRYGCGEIPVHSSGGGMGMDPLSTEGYGYGSGAGGPDFASDPSPFGMLKANGKAYGIGTEEAAEDIFSSDGPILPPPSEMQEEGSKLREWRRSYSGG